MAASNDKIILNKTSSNGSVSLNLKKLREILENLQVFSHPIRVDIVKLLIQKKKKISVTEIYTQLKIEQSVASQHLAVLKNAGLVKAERTGKFILYSLEKEKIDKINKFVMQF